MSPPAGARWPRVLVALLVFLFLAFAVLWTQRKPIARAIIDRALASRGVDVNYRIGRFGLLSQTLTHVRLGDPRSPDLIIDSAKVQLGLSGFNPTILALKARGVRLRGRYENGHLSLGSLDRFMGPSSQEPYSLPDIRLELVDARARIDTPKGVVGLALDGGGRLSDGFEGRLAALMPRLDLGRCLVVRPTAYLHISVNDGVPAFDGPIRAQRIDCGQGGVMMPRLALDAKLGIHLDSWAGNALVQSGALMADGHTAVASRTQIAFAGNSTRTRANGAIDLLGVQASPAQMRRLTAAIEALAATPVGPVAQQLVAAIRRAGRAVTITTRFDADAGAMSGMLTLSDLRAASASGVRLAFDAGAQPIYAWPEVAPGPAGTLIASGGGLPDMSIRIHTVAKGYEGEAEVTPMTAGRSRLALTRIRFRPDRISAMLALSGPVADGWVDNLVMPVDARMGAHDAIILNPTCSTIAFRRLSVGGTTIEGTHLPLCPVGDGLLVRAANGTARGGAEVANLNLKARIGTTPINFLSRRFAVAVGQPGFIAEGVASRIGEGNGATQLSADQLRGLVGSGGIGGSFANLSGRIGTMPLLFSEGCGGWTLANSVLKLGGHLGVRDAASSQRFTPLISDNVGLLLDGGRIVASGDLAEPKSRTSVAHVLIRHDLPTGSGEALLTVNGVTFTNKLQPEMLTPLTLGVIADVRGTVAGRGRVRWNARGVTSDGDFHTEDMALATIFGPIKGLGGTVHFSDLLGLATSRGQELHIAEVNPGIAVTNGVIRYQLLPGQTVAVESGIWPFSGGELRLDPTVIDFARPSERRFTFRVTGLNAAQFVQQFQFRNIAVTGTFDGIIPTIFDGSGGRIEEGHLSVRPGGGHLAYVGEISNADLGRFSKLAFDALKSMRYDGLTIDLDGSLDGEIVSKVSFTGTNEAPLNTGIGKKRKTPAGQFVGLPFRFGITINAPFRALVNSAQSFSDPRGLIRQSLPVRVNVEPPVPVQPKESVKKP